MKFSPKSDYKMKSKFHVPLLNFELFFTHAAEGGVPGTLRLDVDKSSRTSGGEKCNQSKIHPNITNLIRWNDCVVSNVDVLSDRYISKMFEVNEQYLNSKSNSEVGLRLVGGGNSNEGRVEVTVDGRSGTVCYDAWDIRDARVVCRALGLGSAIAAVSSATFGQGSGNILLDEVECSGFESSLTDCANSGIGVHDCSWKKDAGVICTGNST
ncbi:galectin-3-binding protein-like [Anneissia japonica]|uniref:galectin-3-binding protein-like n=1 Tax=Anneissia japonica TaxID=1529436 RepID=UPI001425775A|nr:galectin-3-binding protein-like [Anneissia japonica]